MTKGTRRGSESASCRAEAIETQFFLQDRFFRLIATDEQTTQIQPLTDHTATPEKDASGPSFLALQAILNFEVNSELGRLLEETPTKNDVFSRYDVHR